LTRTHPTTKRGRERNHVPGTHRVDPGRRRWAAIETAARPHTFRLGILRPASGPGRAALVERMRGPRRPSPSGETAERRFPARSGFSREGDREPAPDGRRTNRCQKRVRRDVKDRDGSSLPSPPRSPRGSVENSGGASSEPHPRRGKRNGPQTTGDTRPADTEPPCAGTSLILFYFFIFRGSECVETVILPGSPEVAYARSEEPADRRAEAGRDRRPANGQPNA